MSLGVYFAWGLAMLSASVGAFVGVVGIILLDWLGPYSGRSFGFTPEWGGVLAGLMVSVVIALACTASRARRGRVLREGRRQGPLSWEEERELDGHLSSEERFLYYRAEKGKPTEWLSPGDGFWPPGLLRVCGTIGRIRDIRGERRQ